MKLILSTLLLALLGSGCVTSTFEKRREERSAAYAALSREWRTLVDLRQIVVGMPKDAVYIAWGKPSDVLAGQSEHGKTETWVYSGTRWQEYRYWENNRYAMHGYTAQPHMESDYIPVTYPSAQVVFENGVVKSWNNLASPR